MEIMKIREYEGLEKRLTVCEPGRDCTNCPMRYEEEGDTDLVRVGCTAYEAAYAIKALTNKGSSYGRGWTNGYDTAREESSPHWIKASDWLPTIKDGSVFSDEVYITDGETIAKSALYYGDFGPKWTYTGIGYVTHWCKDIRLPKED